MLRKGVYDGYFLNIDLWSRKLFKVDRLLHQLYPNHSIMNEEWYKFDHQDEGIVINVRILITQRYFYLGVDPKTVFYSQVQLFCVGKLWTHFGHMG